MNNLLDQWNDHIIKGNQLSRELENFEGIMHVVEAKDSKVALYNNGGTTFIDIVLPEDVMAVLKNSVLLHLKNIQSSKETELKKHMNMWKPATINPEFEAAVQSMVQTVKTQLPKPKNEEMLSIKVDKPEPDPMQEKLTDILQTEAKRIEDKPVDTDSSLDKYPAKKGKKSNAPESMTVETVSKMYTVDGCDMDKIAEHFGVTRSMVNNFVYRNGIKRGNKSKKASEPETLRAQNDTEKCRICGKEIQFTKKMDRNMWPYKYQRKNSGKTETVYCCNRQHFIDGKAKDA